MAKTKREKMATYGASLGGVIVAVANAWITIDWDNFQWTQGNIMKLSVSAIIAMGGYFSQFRLPAKKTDETNTQN